VKKCFRLLSVLALLMLVATSGALGAGEKFVVASDIPWAPFEMVTPAGEFFGFDLDVVRAIGVVAGFTVEIKNTAFDTIIEAVLTGKADIGASGFTITAEREANVDFSSPYYLSNQAVVMRKDSPGNLVTALVGMGPNKAVGAQNGTTGYGWVESLQGAGVKVELKGYDTYPMAVLDLVNSRIDAVVQDEPASQASIAGYPDLLTIAGVINTYEYFGFLVANGDPKGILPRVNAAMAQLGLEIVTGAGGMQDLVIKSGSAWANLVRAYFGPSPDKIEAAWLATKNLILNAKTLADVQAFALAFANEANK